MEFCSTQLMGYGSRLHACQQFPRVDVGEELNMAAMLIFEWVTLRDYEAAKERATDEVVERFSRGNTLARTVLRWKKQN